MTKLTVELLLCGAVLVFAYLYLREKYRNLRSRVNEWLRVQRIQAAAAFVGPAAIPQPVKSTKQVVKTVRKEEPTMQPIASAIEVSPVVDFNALDVPAYLRKIGRNPIPSRDVQKAQEATPTSATTHQLVGDEELVIYN